MESILYQKLAKAFNPTVLKIENQSHRHEGHKGSPGTGQSHFSIHIISDKFADLSRIHRHQAIYAILNDEMKETIHALSIQADAPGEGS